jgi:ATP-binding cassette, subfamily B, bacterial
MADPKRKYDSKLARETLRIYLRESLAFRGKFIVALILVPLSAVLMGVGIPFLLSHMIELLSKGKTFDSPEFMTAIYAAVTVSILAVIANRYGFRTLLKLDSDVRARLQQLTFDALIHKSYRFYADHKVGSLTSHYISFIGAHSRLNQLIVNELLTLSLSLFIGLIVIFVQSFILGVTLLGITLLIIAHATYGTRKRAPLRRQRKEMVSELHGVVADDIGNSMIVKMFGKEDVEKRAIATRVKQLRELFYRDFMLFANEGNARHAIMLSFQLVAIVVAAYLLQTGAITIGVVIFSLTYLVRLSSNLFQVGAIIGQYEQAMVEATPMTEVLLETNEVQDAPGAKKLSTTHGKIDFNHVYFSYEEESEHVFKDLDLHIRPKEKIGLVGPSGGGKTTITKLLLRFLDINKGDILIDDQDISKITQASLRESIAYVPQEPLLFHRTLRENIAYSKPNATDEEIEQAAKKAHAHIFIDKLPQKYDTVVGERGVKLSGGQKQRIAIARAILADAPILVMDEATSALDSESEKAIQKALANLMRQKTTIIIAHRLSTIQKMDRIIVLDDGVITESGSHQSLLEKDGTYATLWKHQSDGFIEE